METIKIEKQNTLMIAHRGLSGIEKENTMAAFIAASNRSYYGCECDIHLTSDNVFVVCHDFNTNRVSPYSKVIKDATYQELSNICLYDVGSNTTKSYLKIPTLKEYISISKKYQKQCIIEIKPLFTVDQVQNMLLEINEFDYINNCIFISFTYENLLILSQINKNLRLQYLVGEYNDLVYEKCKDINANLDILYTSLNEEIIKKYHDANLKVNTWTVNNPEIALQLIKYKVDFITSNILE